MFSQYEIVNWSELLASWVKYWDLSQLSMDLVNLFSLGRTRQPRTFKMSTSLLSYGGSLFLSLYANARTVFVSSFCRFKHKYRTIDLHTIRDYAVNEQLNSHIPLYWPKIPALLASIMYTNHNWLTAHRKTTSIMSPGGLYLYELMSWLPRRLPRFLWFGVVAMLWIYILIDHAERLFFLREGWHSL